MTERLIRITKNQYDNLSDYYKLRRVKKLVQMMNKYKSSQFSSKGKAICKTNILTNIFEEDISLMSNEEIELLDEIINDEE